MSTNLLAYSMFQQVFFPPDLAVREAKLQLRRAVRFTPVKSEALAAVPWVVFDFETTGLDAGFDRVIELGAQRIEGGKVVDEFSTLISFEGRLPPIVEKITGITADMLVGQPTVDEVIPSFLRFMAGGILVAHNAAFDMGFLKAECGRLGIDLDWPAFCTLKMARTLLDLERRNLDALAAHYGLTFEARHRSVGDVKVTVAVLQNMLANEGKTIQRVADMAPYMV